MTEYSAWNPGIESQVPMELLHLDTMFRPENVSTSLATAIELKGLTGFRLSELVAFRPERLALHELLIRITADFAVPDGSRIEDLGINFRQIARRLLDRSVGPNMGALVATYDQARQRVGETVEAALNPVIPPSATPAVRAALDRPGFFRRMTSSRRRLPSAVDERGWGPAEIAKFERAAEDPGASRVQVLVLRTLARVLSALFTTHGHAWGSRDLVLSLTTSMVCNVHGSEEIGRELGMLLDAAVSREGYRLLPRQEQPVVINTKGASASGKSTLRPLQKILAGDIGVDWRDFALISPDIWRKQLLDYGSLGAAYKYAGAFTAEEVQIIDQKLDRHMAAKNRRGDMTHLLIDRFRFDSFAADSDEAGSNLLTRFGQTVYLFFVITPPEQLVERAWRRGLEFGRYKALDDTLAHAVVAYAGIPDVFFTWIRRSDKRIRFEFLDNTVPFGEPPRSVAFGDNRVLNVLDVGNLINIDRFARIDVNARSAEAIYPNRELLAARHNTRFLSRCIETFHEVNFADQASGRIYLRMRDGRPAAKDSAVISSAMADPDTRAGLYAVMSESQLAKTAAVQVAEYLPPPRGAGQLATLGSWATRP